MMKPFDLEAFKRGEPALTRDGRKVWYVGWDERDKESPLVVHVDGDEGADSYESNGSYAGASHLIGRDITHMAPRTIKWQVWAREYLPWEWRAGMDTMVSKTGEPNDWRYEDSEYTEKPPFVIHEFETDEDGNHV